MAPTGPAKLRGTVVVACVRLGSNTDHVTRLIQMVDVETSRNAPPKRPSQPKSRSSKDCGKQPLRIDPSRIERHLRERTLLTQHGNRAFERFPDRRGILHQSDAQVSAPGLGPSRPV